MAKVTPLSQANGQADSHEPHPLTHNQGHDVPHPGSERHAYADLDGALRDRIREETVQTDGREQ